MEKTFLEFFAGIGLVHEALRASGWKCVYANDIDPKKHQMYRGHFGRCDYYHEEDVWNATEVLARIANPAFMATASFPCTDMSLAGHFKGFKGEESSTFFGFIHVINELKRKKPKLIMVENVTGFLNSHGGEDFRTAAVALSENGYYVDSFIIDAKHFVPQSRQRLFLLGYHRSLRSPRLIRRPKVARLGDPWRAAVLNSKGLRPDRLVKEMENMDLETGWATIDCGNPPREHYELGDYIDLDDTAEWWTRNETQRHFEMMSDMHREKVESLRKSDRLHVGTIFRRVRQGQLRAEVRFDGVAGCLRTPRGGSAKQIVIVVGQGTLRMRWMSPREYARLQGAGDYAIETGTIQALFGFGDAVCVPVIEWIDKNILSPLYEDYCIQAKKNTRRKAEPSCAS